MKKRLLSIAVLAMMLISIFTMAAFAVDVDASDLETSGNAHSAEAVVQGKTYDKDMYWSGDKLTMTSSTVKGELLAAGTDISISSSSLMQGVKLAGTNISVNGGNIGGTLMAAGNEVTVLKGTSNAAYLAGNKVDFNGTTKCLRAVGNTVTIEGTVNGDVFVTAKTVKIGPNAKITGNLNVSAEKKPSVPSTAVVGGETTFNEDASIGIQTGFLKVAKASNAAWKVFSLFATVFLALILCVFMGRKMDDAKEMIKAKPVPHLLTGLVALICIPILVVVLCITVIGIPVAMLLLTAYIMIIAVSTAFAGSSMGRFVMKNLNPIVASLIGVFVLCLVKMIPFLGGLVSFAAILFTLGWIILHWWDTRKKKNAEDKSDSNGLNAPEQNKTTEVIFKTTD